jgi:hypothetical protein
VPYDILTGCRTCHYGFCQRCNAPDKIVAELCVGLVLVLTAVPSSLDALEGKSLGLDGVDDFVETPQGPRLHLGRQLTFAGLFLVDDLTGESEGW